tara:strand:+ start:878 stop:1168 length:291 start_codon:yes stop_codon:yes gene_type:complete
MKRKYMMTIEESFNDNINKNSNKIKEHDEKLNYLLDLINQLNTNINNFKNIIDEKIEKINNKQHILNKKVNFIENTLQMELNFFDTRSKSTPSYIY